MPGEQNIPHIDIAALFIRNKEDVDEDALASVVKKIGDACRDIGFLSITGTGLSTRLIADMGRIVRAVFDLNEQQKYANAITPENYRGYIPLGFFSPNDGDVNGRDADQYEGYKLHFDVKASDPVCQACHLYGPNIWPDHVPGARQIVQTYWAEMDRISAAILNALADYLGLAHETLQAPFETPLTNMTLLHYPPRHDSQAGFGIHPHKDTSALTIISPDAVGGLKVQTRDGNWIEAICPSGDLIVNIGDILELWSGGRLVSTPHLVESSPGQDRYSFPWFAVPRYDVIVAPLLERLPGFDRPPVHSGHWSAEIWRTNWLSETANDDTPELGTLAGPGITES